MKQFITGLLLLFSIASFSQDTTKRSTNILATPLVGTTPVGSGSVVALSGTAALTTVNLTANATWSSGWVARGQYLSAQTIVYANTNGSYTIEFSEDGGTTLSMPTVTLSYSVNQGTRIGAFSLNASFVRFKYTNAAAAQTAFKFEIRLLTSSAQPSMETLNAAGSDTRSATWTKTRIETKTSDSTNDYRPVYATGNSLNVNVTNPVTSVAVNNLPSIQPVSATALPLPAGASTAANQSTANTTLSSINTQLTTGITTTSTPFTPYNFDYLTNSGVQTVKTSAGIVGSVEILNPTSSDLFLQIFNSTGTVTLGTTAPSFVIPIDATIGVNFNNIAGINFTTGIKYAITTTARGGGTPGSTINISIGYK